MMSTEQSDQVEQYRLKTQFLKNCVRHTTHSDNHEGAREKVEDWRNCGMLGHGGSSVVDKQLELNTGRYRAVKAIDKRRLPSGLDYSRELIVMADLAKHASLFMQFLGWFEESDTLYIAMEYIQLGDLRKHMSRPLPQRAVQQITNQLLQGLKVMHEKGIAHRDLKPENIFVVSMSPVQVKLGDFGISKRIRAQDLTTYHTRLFTRPYAAPEVLGVDANSETSVYTKVVDIWSLGCVIYELLVGAKLFGPEGRIYSYFHGLWSFPENELKKLSPPTDDAGISLIKSMVSLRPDGRPSAVEALGHTWIAGPKIGTSGEDSDEVAQILVDESIGVAEIGGRLFITSPNKEHFDLVVWYRIETEFRQDHVRHTRYAEKASGRNEKVKEVWHNCEELGRGGFNVVHKQIHRTTGHCRVVKTIDKTRLPPDLDYSRELLVMAILAKRPSLFVEFLGWFEQSANLYIAMEYLEQGDLTKHIGIPLPQDTVRNISIQILEGLQVMHQQGMAHRDLKPANIFVVSMSPVWVKLGDFGMSKRIQEASTAFRTQAFTAAYSAPEVQGLDSNSETSAYTNSVDIWSLGCVIYELLARTMLFPGEGDVARYFFGVLPFPEDKLKGLPSPTDNLGISLLKSMLALQPEERPTATGALRHEWLVGLE